MAPLLRPAALLVAFAIPSPSAEYRGTEPTQTAALEPAGACLAFSRAQLAVRRADGTVLTGPATGPLSPVEGISDAVAIAAGATFIALLRDGTVVTWGSKESPGVKAVAGVSNVVRISSGPSHHAALASDGALYIITNDSRAREALTGVSGTRGLGELIVIRGLEQPLEIAAGIDNVFVLQADGTIQSWGNDFHYDGGDGGGYGVLGRGYVRDKATKPAPAIGISNAVGVAASGGAIAAALLADGTVRSWGDRQSEDASLINDNDRLDSEVPITNAGLAGAVALTDGLALFANGTIKEWLTPRDAPSSVKGITSAVAIATGRVLNGVRNATVLADGRVVVWSSGKAMNLAQATVADIGADGARACAAPAPRKLGPAPVRAAPVIEQPELRRVALPPRSGPALQPPPSATHTWSGTITAEKGFPDSHSNVKEKFTATVVFESETDMFARMGMDARSGKHLVRAGSTLRWEISGTDKNGCSYRAGPLEIELARDDASLTIMVIPGMGMGYDLAEDGIQFRHRRGDRPITAELVVSCAAGNAMRHALAVSSPWLGKTPQDPAARKASPDEKTIVGGWKRNGETYSWKLSYAPPAS